MNELSNVQDYLNMIIEGTNKYSKVSFLAFYCMLAEEWCKANNENIIMLFRELYSIVVAVNEQEGPY